MDNQYPHVGKRLVLSIARELILELFKGKSNVMKRDIISKVDTVHKSRGGLKHVKKVHPVTDALGSLKKKGQANNSRIGFWDIFAEEGEANDDKDCVNENAIKTLKVIQSKMKELEETLLVLQELIESVIIKIT